MSEKIPFNIPYIDQREQNAVRDAIQLQELHGNGAITARVCQDMADWLDVRRVFLTTSCTHALELAMLVLGVGPGDEVIMPSFTFVSTANAVVLRGATPVFAEIQPDTLNLNPEDIANRITNRTKLILPVHYAGIGCNMDAICRIAQDADCYVVEDAAQAADAKYKGRFLGTIGDIGAFSFHDTKNITCGEGGAFITSDPEIARRAEIIVEKGTNRAAFLRGEVDKYTWISTGSSYIPSDMLVAMLEVQLAKRAEIKSKRKQVWEAYFAALGPLAAKGSIELPTIPNDCESNYHAFFLRVRTPEMRSELLSQLRHAGIQATFHYVPLHSSPFGRDTLKNDQELPITEFCSQTLIRLPLYPQLADHLSVLTERVTTTLADSLVSFDNGRHD